MLTSITAPFNVHKVIISVSNFCFHTKSHEEKVGPEVPQAYPVSWGPSLLLPARILHHSPEHFGVEKAWKGVSVHEDVDLLLGFVERVNGRVGHVPIDGLSNARIQTYLGRQSHTKHGLTPNLFLSAYAL